MTDILTPEEVKGRDLRTNFQMYDYLLRLEATVEALKRFTKAADRMAGWERPESHAQYIKRWDDANTDFHTARKVVDETGWLK